MPQDVELGPGVRVHPRRVDDRRVVRRRHGDRVGLGQRRDGLGEVADELVLVVLRVELARLADRRAVVVGGVVLRLAEPAPVRAAVSHVEALRGRADGDVLLVEDVGELVVDQLRALVVAGAAPRVERAALELRRVQRLPRGVVVADVRDAVPRRRVRAVEALRVGVRCRRRPARAAPELKVPLLLPVSGTVMPSARALSSRCCMYARPAGRAVVVLVLDLVADHRARCRWSAGGGRGCLSIWRHPLVGVLEVIAGRRVRCSRPAGVDSQPGRPPPSTSALM